MPNPKPANLQLLVRRNKGRTDHPNYATELAHILKTEINPADILDLEHTDRVFSAHHAQSVRSNEETDFGFKRVWRYEATGVWLSFCQCLEDRLRGETGVLFAGPYAFCGGVKVGADRALSAAIPILEFDQDTVRLQSLSSESGLFLDMFEENSEWLIELVVWGHWKAMAENCV